MLFMSMPQQLHAAFETCVRRKLCTMYAESDSCAAGNETAVYCVLR